MERFERGTEVESCYITNMRKTEDNTENLKKQNNHIKKKSTNAQSFCPYMSLHFKADRHKGFCSQSMLQAHFEHVNTHEGAFSSSLNLTG